MWNKILPVLALLCWTNAGTARAERLQLPDSVAVADAASLGSRDEAERRDEVFAGRVVSIDTPVRTNGGDVLIVADTLIINAPIDTRPRFPISRFWVDEPWGFAKQAEHSSTVRKSFADWYLWDDAWDSTSKQLKFRSYSLAEVQAGDAAGIAQMPPGLVRSGGVGTPYWQNAPVDGAAPPGVDRNLYRSGSISIFARVIRFCNGCRREALLEPHPATGDPFDRDRVRLLIASGVKGGRGGLGSLFPCLYDAPPTGGLRAAYCNESIGGRPPSEQFKGGLSGPPGRGGAAGSIRIVLVGNHPFAKTEQEAQRALAALSAASGCDPHHSLPKPDDGARCTLHSRFGQTIAALADVYGGSPSHAGQVRTPAKVALDGTRSPFLIEQATDPSTLMSLFGEDGTLSIEERTPQTALSELAAALTAIDARKHDLAAAGRRLASFNPPGVTPSLMARDMLGDILSSLVVDRQVRLIDSVFGGAFSAPRGNVPSDLLETISCPSNVVAGLSAAELEYLGQYCDLMPVGGANLIQSYLLRTGGLLTLPQFSAAPDVQAAQTVVRLTELNGAVAQLDRSLQRVEGLLFERFTAEDRAEFDEKLSALSRALDAAKAELESKGDLFKQLSTQVKAASSTVGAVTAGVTSGNYVGAAAAIGPALKDVGSVLHTMNQSADERTNTSRATVAEIEKKILAVRDDYDAFLKTVERLRQESAARADATVGRILLARRQVSVDRRVFSADFESLLKFSLINSARDPSARLTSLQTPLRATREAITSWPDPTTRSFPSRAVASCVGTAQTFESVQPALPLTCALVTAPLGRSYQFALAPNRLAGLPLVVIAKTQGRLPVQYYGLVKKSEIKVYTPQGKASRNPVRSSVKEPPEPGLWERVRGWFI